jgi:hypothetical protein
MADGLLSQYGPIVHINLNMVLINDHQAMNSIISRQDLETALKAIRAQRVSGRDWTVTYYYPQNPF